MVGILYIVSARKPVEGTVAENCLLHGTGGLNIDGCRIPTSADEPDIGAMFYKKRGKMMPQNRQNFFRGKDRVVDCVPIDGGRWPANLVLDVAGGIDGCFPEVKAGVAVEPSGRQMNRSIYGETNTLGRRCGFGDSGSASRFFFCYSEQESDEW